MGFKEWLQGKKTYIASVATIVYAISAAYTGNMDWNNAITLALSAFGIGIGLRSALKKVELE